jgi:hypothetical protein
VGTGQAECRADEFNEGLTMSEERDINAAVEYIYTQGQVYAKAKAQRVYLEEYRKSQKAMLMKAAMTAGIKTVAAAEIEAYSDPSYVEILKGIQEATEQEEALRWGLVAAQAKIEVWRSKEASNRMMDRAVM